MKSVLHVTATGAQFWQLAGATWVEIVNPANEPVWVVADLAEEAFQEVQIPKLFGPDRRKFLARQAANRFPDTPYRTILPASRQGGVMDRLLPPRQTMLGLDSAARLTSALAPLSGPVAGVWSISLLMVQLAGQKGLPADLLIVLRDADGLRIVYAKDRMPVISRLIRDAPGPEEQVTEIVRTVRHLENTKILQRTDKPRPLLIMGDTEGFSALLASEQLDVITLPGVGTTEPSKDWRFPLFDLAIKSPYGQLAPFSARTSYVATRWQRGALIAAALTLSIAAGFAGEVLLSFSGDRSALALKEHSGKSQRAILEGLDRQITAAGVNPEFVNQAVTLDFQEIVSAPSLARNMFTVAELLAKQEGARIERFDWRVTRPDKVSCDRKAKANDTPPVNTDAAKPRSVSRVVELTLQLTLPEGLDGKARIKTVTDFSIALNQIDGGQVLLDPARELAQAAISSDKAPAGTGGNQPVWCLTLSDSKESAQSGKP